MAQRRLARPAHHGGPGRKLTGGDRTPLLDRHDGAEREDGPHDEEFWTVTTDTAGTATTARHPGGFPEAGAGAVDTVKAPLYQLKAEFFKTLGHPVRIRVLELLSEREHAVSEMLAETDVEAAHLSQQLAVLRRSNLVVARREGSTVHYSLTSPQVADLLAVARSILSGVLAGQAELLADLHAAAPRTPPPP